MKKERTDGNMDGIWDQVVWALGSGKHGTLDVLCVYRIGLVEQRGEIIAHS